MKRQRLNYKTLLNESSISIKKEGEEYLVLTLKTTTNAKFKTKLYNFEIIEENGNSLLKFNYDIIENTYPELNTDNKAEKMIHTAMEHYFLPKLIETADNN